MYTDDEFADVYVQQFGPVSKAHLTVEKDAYLNTWYVNNHETSTVETVAEFHDEELALWFVQAHANAPRVNNLIRKSLDAAEGAEVDRDRIIRQIVLAGGVPEGIEYEEDR